MLAELTDDSGKPYPCPFCGKKFGQPSGVSHHKRVCPKNNQQSSQNSSVVKDVAHDAAGAHIAANTLTAGNNASVDNSMHNDNSVTNNVTNNIVVLRPFGSEDRFYADDIKFMTQCCKRETDGILDLIKRKHFSPDHPENHNVRVTNLNSPYLKVYDKSKEWVVDTKERVAFDMWNACASDLGTHSDETDFYQTYSTQRFMSQIESEETSTKLFAKCRQRILVSLYNWTNAALRT
jgi:hypothetical protein